MTLLLIALTIPCGVLLLVLCGLLLRGLLLGYLHYAAWRYRMRAREGHTGWFY